ncbi:MAG: SDR family NAD(P)-dependent oxidoreductase [Planctomycetota bacterium]|jgi:NAD(P)-dependent dehydrogenase (short-subunit alcohol dehydrogenase family)|nr:SDR family NAD(P)-dependent oxidoreductase [Planctomycetota bacterium]
MKLNGLTAVVTGGTQGVGAAIAISLARAGSNLILHGLREDQMAQETIRQCQQLGVQVTPIYCDLWQPLDKILAEIGDRSLGIAPEISLLVNNAGVFIDKPFFDMDETTFDRTFDLNVKVGYFLTQYFAKRWIQNKTSGRVLFTASINGLLAESDHTAYDASKAAVSSMVRSLCVALAPKGIRVNAIAPGLVRTPLTNQVLDRDSGALRWMQLHTPNNQVPEASVCGPIAAFLLSDDAEHIHGQTIYIDGGMSVWQQPDLPEKLRTGMLRD